MKLTVEPNPDVKAEGKRLVGSQYLYKLTQRGVTIDVSDALTRLDLKMGGREINVAVISFLLEDVEIDADVLAQLKAHIESKEEADVSGFGDDPDA